MAFWEMVIGYLYTDRRLEMVQYAMFDRFRFICILLLDLLCSSLPCCSRKRNVHVPCGKQFHFLQEFGTETLSCIILRNLQNVVAFPISHGMLLSQVLSGTPRGMTRRGISDVNVPGSSKSAMMQPRYCMPSPAAYSMCKMRLIV